MISLPDVNVLMALAWAQHQHHQPAHTWFATAAPAGWATCLLTQTAFLRLSLNPHVVQVSLDCATVRGVLAGLVAHPNHQYIQDAPALTSDQFDAIGARIRGHQQVTDATLLYFAQVHGLKLVTFDRGIHALSPQPGAAEVLIA